jgi:hypothetical protein
MNYDFTGLTKNISNDNLCFNYLEHKATYVEGLEKFILKGVENIEIYYNPNASEISIKANFPYFMQGHNFSFSSQNMKEAIQYTSELLNLNLFDSLVKTLEFGSIIELDFPIDEFLFNHISLKGKAIQPHLTQNKLTGKYFKDGLMVHKLYNAGANMKSKLSSTIREDLSNNYGYDKAKNYLKIENHYKKPEVYFKKRNLYLNEVLNSSFMNECKEDLITTYKSIMKTGIIKLPEDKKNINAGTIPLLILKELEALFHFNSEELIYLKLKSIPEEILNKNDKKARKAIISSNLDKINNKSVLSNYDITSKLENTKIY